MNNLDFSSWYFELNLLLAIFWFVWFMVDRIFQYLKLRTSPNLRLTISRILFTSFLIGPLLARLIPDFDSKKISARILNQPIALSEVFISNLDMTLDLEIATNVLNSRSNLFDILALFIILGLLIRIFWSLKSAIKLAAIVNKGYLWKKAGKLHIIISDKIAIPFSTVILGRCHILIPVSLLTKPKDLRVVIRHEGQHHKNGDTWWVFILELAKIVFYWNPFIYLWGFYFESLHEFACDETLINQKTVSSNHYGNILIGFAETVSTTRYRLTGAVNMVIKPLFFGSQLKTRIQLFSTYTKTNGSALRSIFLASPLILFSFTIAIAINGSTSNNQLEIEKLQKSTEKVVAKALQDRRIELDQIAHTPSIVPTDGYISSRYGTRTNPFTGKENFHEGIDIANSMDTPIYAPAAGLVIKHLIHRLHGNVLVINHGNSIITRYTHLNSFEKKVGQKVTKGELIARMGNSGRSTAPHLHFEVIINDVPVDPEAYMTGSKP